MNTDKIYAEAIVNEYSRKDDSKVIALRKLDRKAKRPATVLAYVLGVAFTLLLGLGMCFVLGRLGHGGQSSLVAGIVLGILGLVGLGLNFPLYNRNLSRAKEEYAADILALAKKISEEGE